MKSIRMIDSCLSAESAKFGVASEFTRHACLASGHLDRETSDDA
jgi:hypothetical protein